MADREESSGANHYKLPFTMGERQLNSEQTEVQLEQLNERVDALTLEKILLTDELSRLCHENIKLKTQIFLLKGELCKIIGAENLDIYLQSLADEDDN